MAPEPSRPRAARALPGLFTLLCVLPALTAPAPAHAFRVVNYNITNYPSVILAQRQPAFRKVLSPLGPDVLVAQEVQSQAGVDSFLTNVLNVIEPGQWSAAPFTNGNDTDNALFYKPSRVQFLGSWAFYPNPANLLRYVNCYRLKPAGYSSAAAELRIYSQHLKASTGSTNVNQRAAEATGIRDSMNAAPPGTHMILTGDFNIYTSTEPAFQKFLESQVDNDGRLYDPLNAIGTFNAAGFASIHTQCPCLSCPTGSGFSGGGLDDRFDMFLPTFNMNDGQGLDLIVSTYKPVGNDGLHYNLNITDAPAIPEDSVIPGYSTALWNASDHLPIRVDLQLPARAGAPASLAFGTVITGGPASQTIAISNANAPSDVLDALTYSYTAPAGFSAPAGTFDLPEGTSSSDAIDMSTATPGVQDGTLLVATDDPDRPTIPVTLSGTVLRHASASLDSLVATALDTLDFGEHETGGFAPLEARAHNRGWDALQARLSLSAAAITGGDGHFSLVSAFTPTLLAGTGASVSVAFDDAATTADSTYEAMLTFTSADEALPGALAQPDLGVRLLARRASGTTTDAPPDAPPPSLTTLFAPFPNPLVAESTVRFDVARGGEVRLEAFDLSGRRVATLIATTLAPGRYTARWNAAGTDGRRVGAGLYFLRLDAPGSAPRSVRLAVVR